MKRGHNKNRRFIKKKFKLMTSLGNKNKEHKKKYLAFINCIFLLKVNDSLRKKVINI